MKCCEYDRWDSQHFIFFVTYEWAYLGRVLHYCRLESLNSNKHSSLLDPLVSCEENEVLRIQPQDRKIPSLTFDETMRQKNSFKMGMEEFICKVKCQFRERAS
jgi:hypothetical protein